MVDKPYDDQEVTRVPTRSDLVAIAKSLNDGGGRYIIMGGMAMIEHGLRRTTMDIDLLIDDDPDHVQMVCEHLAAILTDGAAKEVCPQDVRDYMVVRINDEITIDLMGSACGVDYESAKNMIEWVDIDGVRVPFASAELLLKTKQTLRDKDRLDRHFLIALINRDL